MTSFLKEDFYHSLNIFRKDEFVTYKEFYDFFKNGKNLFFKNLQFYSFGF